MTYYLVRMEGEEPTNEDRRRAWLSLDEARERLTFPDARRILERAAMEVRG